MLGHKCVITDKYLNFFSPKIYADISLFENFKIL